MHRHTAIVITAAVVILVALLGWYALVAYVVAATGSTSGLADVATATAHILRALLDATTA